MEIMQFESARAAVQQLQQELEKVSEPAQRAELEGRLMEAQSYLTTLQEQQIASAASERTSESSVPSEWVHTKTEARLHESNGYSMADALGFNDRVTVTETSVQMDSVQRDLYERGTAYQEFAPAAEREPQAPEQSTGQGPSFDDGLQISAGAMQAEAAPIEAMQYQETEAQRVAQDSGMEARHIENGEEISGEIAEIAHIEGQAFYAVDTENEATGKPERVLVPVGDTEHEPGDEIQATKTPQGVQIEQEYGYGR